jgi:cyclopropane fatty-acyl-phospholipid synthase-like methyltransferase
MDSAKREEINNNLIGFWNEAIGLDENMRKELLMHIVPEQYAKLAPSEKLLRAVERLGKCRKVLDYGCGSGWAGIIAARSGCKSVTAVDMGEKIIDSAKFHADAYKVGDRIDTVRIDGNWLKNVQSETFDGIVCSNVLDVVPVETSREIVKELARIAESGARIVIGLNFYMSKDMAEKRGIELVEDKYLFSDGVLRLTSLSDDEWKDIFTQYFAVENLDHFAWPGEEKETRRLFLLSKQSI